jgi:hypothetical protein
MFYASEVIFSVLPIETYYLDPGSGSFFLQLLVAGLLGASIALRAYWGKFLGLFGVKPKQKDEDAEEKDE